MASRGYKLSTTVDRKYAPLINRTLPIHEQTPKAQFGDRRDEGATNIDLWVDGRSIRIILDQVHVLDFAL